MLAAAFDSLSDEDMAVLTDESKSIDWDRYRAGFDRASDYHDEWQGMPVVLPDMPLRLHDRHPRWLDYMKADMVMSTAEYTHVDRHEDVREDQYIRNSWHSMKLNADIIIYQEGDKVKFIKRNRAPERSMERLTLWMSTIGASDAWQLSAEAKAIEKLAGMVSGRQMRHYLLTGSFLETSPRSGLTYIFRRLRPTIALTPRQVWYRRYQGDNMRCLAVLCLHGIGYYESTWAGALVPTDDVISHLTMMRGDEAFFWRNANQHDPASPQAGL